MAIVLVMGVFLSLNALHERFKLILIFSGSEYHEESNWSFFIENQG
jgi:hypothetical protein